MLLLVLFLFCFCCCCFTDDFVLLRCCFYFCFCFFSFDTKTSTRCLSNNKSHLLISTNIFLLTLVHEYKRDICGTNFSQIGGPPPGHPLKEHTVMFPTTLKNPLLIFHERKPPLSGPLFCLKGSYPVREGSTTPNPFVFPAQIMATGKFQSKKGFCLGTSVIYVVVMP